MRDRMIANPILRTVSAINPSINKGILIQYITNGALKIKSFASLNTLHYCINKSKFKFFNVERYVFPNIS